MPYLAHEPGLRVSVGISRSGKTFGIRTEVLRAVAAGVPVIVLDRVKEWTSAPASLRGVTAGALNVRDAARLIESSGARLVIVRPVDVCAAALEACSWVKDYPGVAGVAFPEGHNVAPAGRLRLPQALDDIASAWAHHKVALWIDSQRMSKLHSDVVENAADLRLYAMVGERDLKRLTEFGQPELQQRVRECASLLAAGQAGWHVRLGMVRTPPYEITREV